MPITNGISSSPGIENVELNITERNKLKLKVKNRGLKANLHKLQIGNMNVTTAKDDAKLVQVLCASRDLGHELFSLTETHRTGEGVIDTWPLNSGLEGRKLVYSGFKKKAQAGVALCLSGNCKLEEFQRGGMVCTGTRTIHKWFIEYNSWQIPAIYHTPTLDF